MRILTRMLISHGKSSCFNNKEYNQSITMSTITLNTAGFPAPRTRGTTPGDPGTGSFFDEWFEVVFEGWINTFDGNFKKDL